MQGWWPGDSEQPDLVPITKSVGQLSRARRDMERLLSAVASHHNSHRHTLISPHDLLDIFETLDCASVDAKNDIARLDAAPFRRASGLHLSDFGRSKGLGHSYFPFSSAAAG
jgi:hypothetical protein